MESRVLIGLDLSDSTLARSLDKLLASRREYLVAPAVEPGRTKVVIMELDAADPSHTLMKIRTLVQAAPTIQIILTAARISRSHSLQAVQAGAKDFLSQPFLPAEVEQVVARAQERLKLVQPASQLPRGRILSVFGAKGGIGTSTIAVNLAIGLKRVVPSKTVALVDLNLMAGDAPLLLGVEPAHTLRDFAWATSNLDHAFLISMLAKHASGIELLSSGYEDLTGSPSRTDHIERLLIMMQSLFDWVVVDCGHDLDTFMLKVLDLASTVLLVTAVSLPVVRRTKSLLTFLRATAWPPDKLKLILNRFVQDDADLLTETEQALECPTFWRLPNDYRSASSAINTGRPLMSAMPRLPLSRSFAGLAAALMPDGASRGTGSSFSDCVKAVTTRMRRMARAA